MKISIVTAYYNRRQLLINTLKSISKTSHDDFEVIVVDDGSTEENKIGDLPNEYPFLKVIRVEPEDKWYINPCVPFNRGFKEASGEIVILQNPVLVPTTFSLANNITPGVLTICPLSLLCHNSSPSAKAPARRPSA